MVDYSGLFILLRKKKIKKVQLQNNIGFSSATLSKLIKNEYVTLRTIEKICKELNCNIQEIIKFY